MTTDAQARKAADVFKKYDDGLEDKAMTTGYQVRDGVVCFKNPAEVKKVIEEGSSKLAASLRRSSPDFVSFQDMVNRAMEAAKTVKSAAEATAFLKEWGAYVREENETLVPRMISLTDILSKDGLLYVGKRLYMFTENEEFIIYDGDKKRVNDVRAGKVDDGVVLRTTTKANVSVKGGRVAATCTILQGFKEVGARRGYVGCYAERRDIELGPNAAGITEFYTFAYVNTIGSSTKKVWWWWEQYNTEHTLRVNYRAIFSVNGNVFVDNTVDTPLISQGDTYDIRDFRPIGSNVVTIFDVILNTVSFVLEARQGVYTSRGLNGQSVPYSCP